MDSDSKSYWDRPEVRRSVLFSLLVSAAVFRFATMGRQPLWLDEAVDASFASLSFWSCVFAEHVHPPLYRTLLHFVVLGFGDSAAALRFLPAVFGTLAVPMIAILARQLVPQGALTAAALVATSPFLIFFSQENRDYSLFILLALLSTWAFLRFRETGRGLALYCGLSVLLLYTHYLAVFILLAHEVVYWRHSHQRIRDWMLARVAVLAAFAPWALWVAGHYRGESRIFLSPLSLVPTALIRFFLGYGILAVDSTRLSDTLLSRLLDEGPIIIPTLCLFGWLLWRGARRVVLRPEVRTLLTAMIFIPWVALVLLSPWTRLVHERYLAFQAPFILLLAAAGLCSLRWRARLSASLALALVIGFSLVAYYGAPGSVLGYRLRYAKENWPGAAAFIRQEHPDTVIVAPEYISVALDRYPLGEVREIRTLADCSTLPDLQGTQRVALVISHSGLTQESLRASLEATYPRIAHASFPSQNSIQVDIYDTSQRPRILARNSSTADKRGR